MEMKSVVADQRRSRDTCGYCHSSSETSISHDCTITERGSSSRPTPTPLEVISTYDEELPGILPRHTDPRTISDILWYPIEDHKIDLASSYSTELTGLRHNKIHIPFHPLMAPALKRL